MRGSVYHALEIFSLKTMTDAGNAVMKELRNSRIVTRDRAKYSSNGKLRKHDARDV